MIDTLYMLKYHKSDSNEQVEVKIKVKYIKTKNKLIQCIYLNDVSDDDARW